MYTRIPARYRQSWPVAWPRLWGGLGQAEEADCPEPVSPQERDQIAAAVRAEMPGHEEVARFHWAGGHPDLNAVHMDLWEKTHALIGRAKLLRCSAEARRRALTAIDEYRQLFERVHRSGAVVVEAPGFWFRSGAFPGMRPYFIRGEYGEGRGFVGGKPPAHGPEEYTGGPTLSAPALPGSAAPTPAPSGDQLPGAVATADVTTLPPQAQGILSALTEGEIFGIPKRYLVYGGLGLLAFSLIRAKR